MDTRTGQLYPSKEAAHVAGVAEQDLAEVSPIPEHVRPLRAIRVEKGPFKGRVYEVVAGRRGRRLRHLERPTQADGR